MSSAATAKVHEQEGQLLRGQFCMFASNTSTYQLKWLLLVMFVNVTAKDDFSDGTEGTPQTSR